MTTNLNIIKLDYFEGNLIITLAMWHGDKMTISIPLTKEVRKKIKGEK